jgi:hypothetical protein
MNPKENELEKILERTSDEIRTESLSADTVEESARRVWQKISGAAESVTVFRNCQDFEILFPAYLEHKEAVPGSSSTREDPQTSRLLLLEDHIKECVSCRKKLEEVKKGPEKTRSIALKESKLGLLRVFPLRWKPVLAVAATLLLVAGLWKWPLVQQYVTMDGSHLATIRSIEGNLYLVDENSVTPISVSAAIASGQRVRTAKDSQAQIQLADGSVVEMAPRSEFSVKKNWDGLGIMLDRGQIIVQAAKQHGHMVVTTEDCQVSVIGTVFAVNHGLKGSRVSVMEGKVQVTHGRQADLVTPGGQVVTSSDLENTPISEEVAWSRNATQYLVFLQELKAVRDHVEQAGLLPGLRYQSPLLELAPAGTAAYVAIPNFSRALNESFQMLEQRIQENEVLRSWWEEKFQRQGNPEQLKEVLAKIQTFGQYLGDEIVICLSDQPVFLAEVKRPEDLRGQLKKELDALTSKLQKTPPIQIVENADALRQLAPMGSKEGLTLYLPGPYLAISPNLQALHEVAGFIDKSQSNSFVTSAFHARLQQAYHEGADWLLGVDLESGFSPARRHPADRDAAIELNKHLSVAGLDNLKYLVLEHKNFQGHTNSRAAFTFSGARHGLAAWLSAPASMGTLGFVSPNASFVTGFLVKNPAQLLDEALQWTRSLHDGGDKDLEALQQELGLNIREDLVAPLGGEFALAMDGPILPTPSWKVILEVNDPARLQQGLRNLVTAINGEMAKSGKPSIRLEAESIGGRPGFQLIPPKGIEIHLLFSEGYLIVAPSQAMITQALQSRESGNNLPQSAAFKALLPRDGQPFFSGLVYQNLGPVIKPLAEWAGNLTDKSQPLVEALTKDTTPSIIYFYGEEDSILMGSTTPLSSLGLNLGSLLHLPNLGRTIERAH